MHHTLVVGAAMANDDASDRTDPEHRARIAVQLGFTEAMQGTFGCSRGWRSFGSEDRPRTTAVPG